MNEKKIFCNNCQTNFKNFHEFKTHFNEENKADCNILLEEEYQGVKIE